MRAAGRVAASASLLSLSAVLASVPAALPAFVVRPHFLAARTLASTLRPLCRAPVRTPSARQRPAMGATVKTEPLPGGAAADDTPEGAQGIWRSLAQSPAELRCGVTLVCGQSFRWRATGEAEWTGVIADQMVTVREDGPCVRLSAWRRQGAETAANHDASDKSIATQALACSAKEYLFQIEYLFNILENNCINLVVCWEQWGFSPTGL